MSHTPGPWVKDGWSILEQKNRTVICNVLPWDASGCRDEDISNARLIAAAPKMLEALEEVDECSRYWSEYDVPIGLHDRIQAALVEARG